MSSPWCRAWEIGSGDIFSGYGNKTLDKKIELKFSGNCWDISWCLYFLTLNRFCKPGEWVLILHADLFKFHPEPVWRSIKYKLCASYSLFILHNANDISFLTSTQEANEWTIYPWIHSNCNSLSDNDQLRAVSFPDIHPSRYLLSHSHVYHISVAIDYER